MSLESLARTLLTDFALHPEIKFLDEKYQVFFKDVPNWYILAGQRSASTSVGGGVWGKAP